MKTEKEEWKLHGRIYRRKLVLNSKMQQVIVNLYTK